MTLLNDPRVKDNGPGHSHNGMVAGSPDTRWLSSDQADRSRGDLFCCVARFRQSDS